MYILYTHLLISRELRKDDTYWEQYLSRFRYRKARPGYFETFKL